jgi:hypothetical protein
MENTIHSSGVDSTAFETFSNIPDVISMESDTPRESVIAFLHAPQNKLLAVWNSPAPQIVLLCKELRMD